MGVAISYTLGFEGTQAELLRTLEMVRSEIARLDVKPIDKVLEIPPFELTELASAANPLAFSLTLSMQHWLQVRQVAGTKGRGVTDKSACKANGVGFHVLVSDECEPLSVFLGRFGEDKYWFGGGFTKTMSELDFIGVHQTIIPIFQVCKAAGILESVCDEAEVWKDEPD